LGQKIFSLYTSYWGDEINTGLSIVIPYFNGSAFIKETLDSACNSVSSQDEIIIVDGSINTATETALESKHYKNLQYYLFLNYWHHFPKQLILNASHLDQQFQIKRP
jgi:hypothetical protein